MFREVVRALEEYHGEKFTLDDFELAIEMLNAITREEYSRGRFVLILDEAFCRNHGLERALDPKVVP
jgi:hypothetical protein